MYQQARQRIFELIWEGVTEIFCQFNNAGVRSEISYLLDIFDGFFGRYYGEMFLSSICLNILLLAKPDRISHSNNNNTNNKFYYSFTTFFIKKHTDS